MPIQPPALDDRSFADLVEEMLARIPAHAPEYTNPRLGDPGRTLIELFAFLADSILYRANLVPERQRLAFLRLLGAPMRPALAARGVVGLGFADETVEAVTLAPMARLKGPVPFETLSEVTVVPVTAEGFYKRKLSDDEHKQVKPMLPKLELLYGTTSSVPYVTTPVFAGGAAVASFDLRADTIDGSLWLALLAPKEELVDAARTALGRGPGGRQVLLSVGVMPMIEVPETFADVHPPVPVPLISRVRIPHVWEVSTGRMTAAGLPEYIVCDEIADSTGGLSRRGVVRLLLPSSTNLGAWPNDVREPGALKAGTGDLPPRLDNARQAKRLVAWLRLRPQDASVERLALSWVGINAVEIDQRTTSSGRVIGQSNGLGDQVLQLPATAIDRTTLALQVEDPRGYVTWTSIDDLALAGRDDRVYQLDSEAGTVRFGDGVRGRIPAAGMRVRVALMRAGGGRAGNLPPRTLKDVESATDLEQVKITRKLTVLQSVATDGGQDAEDLATAELRIPQLLRNRDRAVTSEDFRVLAAQTPGVMVGRADVMPGFKPQQRRANVPGVVSVMVLPWRELGAPPNPRPDRPFLDTVSAFIDERRLVTTELYVIGARYKPIGISVGVQLRDGVDRDSALNSVRLALRQYLWPLAPGGNDGTGWPRGRAVRDREVEVVVAQVPGVLSIQGVHLFSIPEGGTAWVRAKRQIIPLRQGEHDTRAEIPLEDWELPELIGLAVGEGPPGDDLAGTPNPLAADGVAVPVVPDPC
jgi:predicted phage baseplate assembly protein